MKVTRSVVTGTGSYLPERVLTNADLAKMVETSDEWIAQRTGIRERHIAAPDEYTSHLALKAAQRALDAAGRTVDDIDLIVLATATPDNTFPATAVAVQDMLGMHHGMAFDMQAVCSGFVYALTTADLYVTAGRARRALVIGAETFSRILDWQDRTTCVLFGDGAGAVVIEASEEDEGPHGRGVLGSRLRSEGRHKSKLYVDGGPGSTGTVGHLRMEGRDVFRHAVGIVSDVIDGVLGEVGLEPADIDWFVPHQANKRIIDATARKFGWPDEKVVATIDLHGNTSAASIPLALDVAVRDGRIQSGDCVMLEAMGGGFTWGAVVLRW